MLGALRCEVDLEIVNADLYGTAFALEPFSPGCARFNRHLLESGRHLVVCDLPQLAGNRLIVDRRRIARFIELNGEMVDSCTRRGILWRRRYAADGPLDHHPHNIAFIGALAHAGAYVATTLSVARTAGAAMISRAVYAARGDRENDRDGEPVPHL